MGEGVFVSRFVDRRDIIVPDCLFVRHVWTCTISYSTYLTDYESDVDVLFDFNLDLDILTFSQDHKRLELFSTLCH